MRSFPALAVGAVLSTVTVTKSVDLHPLETMVASMAYVVVELGFAKGFDIVEELKPAVGVHE
jgi:hypothetical protein